MKLPESHWEAVPGFPFYAISRDGEIVRTRATDTLGRAIKRRTLKSRLDPDGYQHVCLRHGRRSATFRVHTLVLTTFIGPAEGREANHKNGVRHDNRLANLEWLTHAENIRATYRAGRGAQQKPGYRNPRNTISPAEAVQIINRLECGESAASVARHSLVSLHVVKNIQRGKTWKAARAAFRAVPGLR